MCKVSLDSLLIHEEAFPRLMESTITISSLRGVLKFAPERGVGLFILFSPAVYFSIEPVYIYIYIVVYVLFLTLSRFLRWSLFQRLELASAADNDVVGSSSEVVSMRLDDDLCVKNGRDGLLLV